MRAASLSPVELGGGCYVVLLYLCLLLALVEAHELRPFDLLLDCFHFLFGGSCPVFFLAHGFEELVLKSFPGCQPILWVGAQQPAYHVVAELSVLLDDDWLVDRQIAVFIVHECLFVVTSLERVLLEE